MFLVEEKLPFSPDFVDTDFHKSNQSFNATWILFMATDLGRKKEKKLLI